MAIRFRLRVLTVQSVFASRVSHASNDPRPPIARAESPVTDDPGAVAAKVYVVSAVADRIDAYTMSDHTPSVRIGRGFTTADGESTVIVKLKDSTGQRLTFVLTDVWARTLAYELGRANLPNGYPNALEPFGEGDGVSE